MSSSERSSPGLSLRDAGSAASAPSSMWYFLLSSIISAANLGSLTCHRNTASATSMMTETIAKNVL